VLPDPSGCLQLAPGVHFHHCEKSFKETGPAVGVKTSAPGRSCSPDGGGVPGGTCFMISSTSGGFSAVVT